MGFFGRLMNRLTGKTKKANKGAVKPNSNRARLLDNRSNSGYNERNFLTSFPPPPGKKSNWANEVSFPASGTTRKNSAKQPSKQTTKLHLEANKILDEIRKLPDTKRSDSKRKELINKYHALRAKLIRAPNKGFLNLPNIGSNLTRNQIEKAAENTRKRAEAVPPAPTGPGRRNPAKKSQAGMNANSFFGTPASTTWNPVVSPNKNDNTNLNTMNYNTLTQELLKSHRNIRYLSPSEINTTPAGKRYQKILALRMKMVEEKRRTQRTGAGKPANKVPTLGPPVNTRKKNEAAAAKRRTAEVASEKKRNFEDGATKERARELIRALREAKQAAEAYNQYEPPTSAQRKAREQITSEIERIEKELKKPFGNLVPDIFPYELPKAPPTGPPLKSFGKASAAPLRIPPAPKEDPFAFLFNPLPPSPPNTRFSGLAPANLRGAAPLPTPIKNPTVSKLNLARKGASKPVLSVPNNPFNMFEQTAAPPVATAKPGGNVFAGLDPFRYFGNSLGGPAGRSTAAAASPRPRAGSKESESDDDELPGVLGVLPSATVLARSAANAANTRGATLPEQAAAAAEAVGGAGAPPTVVARESCAAVHRSATAAKACESVALGREPPAGAPSAALKTGGEIQNLLAGGAFFTPLRATARNFFGNGDENFSPGPPAPAPGATD
jgi:hypothetical protein